MATKAKMLTGIFRDGHAASHTYTWLLERGYRSDEINVLMTDRARARFSAREEGQIKAGSKAAEGMATGGAVGTAVGAGVAALAAIGSSVFIPPPLGWWVAGPVFGALAGGGAGAVAGGAIGALIGMGISESNAAAYEEALRNGGVVIGVTPRNSEEASIIQKQFEAQKADNLIFA